MRESRPNATIHLMVGASCRDVAEHLPYFDDLVVIDDARLLAGGIGGKLAGALDLLQRFRGYDEAIILHRDSRYAMLARVAGIDVRRGFAGPLASRFLTHPYEPPATEHHTTQYLRVAGFDAGSRNGPWVHRDGELEQSLNRIRSLGFGGQNSWVALGFGGGNNVKTRTALKSWPLQSYLALADDLRRAGHSVVWLGDSDDAALLGGVERGLVLAGKVSVAETAAVISQSRLVVANDTMILHLADSLGTPAIGLFGPTQPYHYGPRGERSTYLWAGRDLPCSPCHTNGHFPPCGFAHRCMTQLTVRQVADEAMRILR